MGEKMIKKHKNLLNKLGALLMTVALIVVTTPVNAASLTSISDTLTRQKAATASSHTIKFTTSAGIASGNTVTFVFPGSSFTMAASLTGVTIADNAGADNAVTSASWSAPTLTITASASSIVVAGHAATIKIPSNQITNPAAGTYIVSIGGTFSDTGKMAIVIVTDDQVSLSATVDPSMTFSLSTNSSAFGTLSGASVATASPNITLTVATNATSGYTITVSDQGSGTAPGLYNSGSSYNISSTTTTLAAGAEGYGIQASSASATVASPYNTSGNGVGALSRTPQNLASFNSNTTADHTVTVAHLAAISGSTKSGSYADTITYIATGNF
jgi:hypothetical protein